MQIVFKKFDFFVFDCDGVILESNLLKTIAFENSLSEYPDEKVFNFIKYHKSNGGVSRYKKFEYFFKEVMKIKDSDNLIKKALKNYESYVFEELLSCNFIPGVKRFLKYLKEIDKDIYVNSGSSEKELKEIFKLRKIDHFFKNVMGSPNTKKDNMKKIILEREDFEKGLFFGDSKLDLDIANQFSLSFIIVNGFSEWEDRPVNLTKINDFRDINI